MHRLACLLCLLACTAQAQPTPDRPNLVVILADDLGFSDLGCFGSEIHTPRLDALAADGLRFRQFYNTAKCHSSRVAILTGLYCDQAGAESMSRGVTVAQLLRDAGYFTAMTGKWHLDDQPTDHGFSRYFGHLSGATNFFTGDNTFRLNGEPFTDFPDDFYTTTANTDHAITFVDEALAADQPFFLYVAHNAPHYPLHVLEEDFNRYRDAYTAGWDDTRATRYAKQVELGVIDPDTTPLSPRPEYIPAWDALSDDDRAWEAERMAAYAGMVDRLDRETGRLIDHLVDRGVLDNTLILFVSDNGACPFERTRRRDLRPWDPESYWTYDVGWAHVGNTPFRWYKQNSHEGGIASPAIVHWPAGLSVEPGTWTDTPAHLIDVMATALDLAGVEYPAEYQGRAIEPLMGRPLTPAFAGEPIARDFLYFQFGPNRGLRRGDWKLVTFRAGPWELYNLAADRSETVNLAADRPELVAELAALWHTVAEDTDRLPARQRRPVADDAPPSGFRGDR